MTRTDYQHNYTHMYAFETVIILFLQLIKCIWCVHNLQISTKLAVHTCRTCIEVLLFQRRMNYFLVLIRLLREDNITR